MKTDFVKRNKRLYSSPLIELIVLDNEIALILESNPPSGPYEGQILNVPEFFKTDPFVNNLG